MARYKSKQGFRTFAPDISDKFIGQLQEPKRWKKGSIASKTASRMGASDSTPSLSSTFAHSPLTTL
jgi:hypothetical protein